MRRSGNPISSAAMARGVARRRGVEAAALPPWIRPQLTQFVDAAPEGDHWIHVTLVGSQATHG